MVSTWMIVALTVAYVVIAVASMWEGNWPRTLYFFGAVLINQAILLWK